MSEFFAYVHCDTNLVPFYVGRGTYRRVKDKSRHNIGYKAKKAEIGPENIQIGYMECSTLEASCELEAGMIKCLTRMGVELTNCAKGGLGGGSFERTPEQKVAMSEATKGKIHSEESKKELSERMKGNKWNVGKTLSKETKEKISAKLMGNNWNLGRKASEETKLKMSIAKMGNLSNIGKKQTEERRVAMSRLKGGKPIRCEKDGEVRIYLTRNDAAKGIGYDSGNLGRVLRGTYNPKNGCNGWQVSFVDITDA